MNLQKNQCVLVSSTSSDSQTVLNERNCAFFSYVGESYHIINLPKGDWYFELWGAGSGLSAFEGESPNPGLGAYVSGVLKLSNSQTLYGYVGGRGGDNTPDAGTGGYNGGAQGGRDTRNQDCGSGGGGGATDIRLEPDNLYSRIIVAGGGGSPGCYIQGGSGGSGGTIYGNDGSPNSIGKALGGSGGDFAKIEMFGKGQNGYPGTEAGGSGGGGYFGGYGGESQNVGNTGGAGGGGGSSYVSGCTGCQTLEQSGSLGSSKHSSGLFFTSITMIGGNETMITYVTENLKYRPHYEHGLIKITRYHLPIRQSCFQTHFKGRFISVFL